MEVNAKVSLVDITPNPEKVIEFCARQCYATQDKITDTSASKLIRSLLSRGHSSMIENAKATFHISGVSRAMSHQIVRHRMASFAQQSQRYVKEHDFDYITPSAIKASAEAEQVYLKTIEDINKAYEALTKTYGITPEDARFLLPNACETQMTVTANFREWLHIIDLRVDSHAQWEIREVMTQIWKILYSYAPTVFHTDSFNNSNNSLVYKTQIFETRII